MRLFRRKKISPAYVIEESIPHAHRQPAAAHIQGQRAKIAARARQRIGMCAICFVAAFVALGGRLTYVSMSSTAQAAYVSSPHKISGPRAEILDRKGAILATNLPVITLEVDGREVWDPAETAQKLSTLIEGIDVANLTEHLAAKRNRVVARSVSPKLQREIFALGLPGVKFIPRESRFYPQGALAAHLIGHAAPGRGGLMGLEAHVDRSMGAEPVNASVEVAAQQVLEAELKKAVSDHDAKAGMAVVMDVRSGEILALANWPEFDPNDPGAAAADSRRNRAVYDLYEMGSAFKAITAAVAIEEGAASEASAYDARGVYHVADRTIRDFHGKNRLLTLSEVVQYSSNIGTARVAADIGIKAQKEYMEALGMFDALPIELPENRTPMLPARWGPVEAATISFGHGISVTPLHLVTAFAALVNGGVYLPPTFVKQEKLPAGEQVFSPTTSKAMRRILRRVVVDGTAGKAEAAGYYPIGKTSTAEKPINGRYSKTDLLSSFIGAFPGYDPKYAVLVTLDEPKASPATKGYATAGWNAAPAFAQIVARLAPALGVMPVSEGEALAAFYGNGNSSAVRRTASQGVGGQ